MIEHGGDLRRALALHGGHAAEWLDLSTGVNPHGYPAPALAAQAWHRLPEIDPALIDAACAYYCALDLLPVAGTQAAIQTLPRLRLPGRVAIVAPTYGEHARCWQQVGHTVTEIALADADAAVNDGEVLVVVNPNNPTGDRVPAATLLGWAERMARRGGWLVVDEAFADVTPGVSVAAECGQPGLVVLRSVGKFFGLAGLRLGFVGAEPGVLRALSDLIGPWTVSGPAQAIGTAALNDRAWQTATHARLAADGARLHALLRAHDLPAQGTALFQWWPCARPAAWQAHLARHRIWCRQFSTGATGVRLGLPPDEAGWQRLADALASLPEEQE